MMLSQSVMRLVSIGWISPRSTRRWVSRTQTLTTSAWNPACSFVTASSELVNVAVWTSRLGLSSLNGPSTWGTSSSSNEKMRRSPETSPGDAPGEPDWLELELVEETHAGGAVKRHDERRNTTQT